MLLSHEILFIANSSYMESIYTSLLAGLGDYQVYKLVFSGTKETGPSVATRLSTLVKTWSTVTIACTNFKHSNYSCGINLCRIKISVLALSVNLCVNEFHIKISGNTV